MARNRGTIATAGATIGCLIPGVGWGSCGALQAGALAVRAQQRAQEGGGFRATWKANVGDALFAAANFGTVGIASRLARFGRLGFWRQPKGFTATGMSMRWWHKLLIIGGSAGGPALKFYGCQAYRRGC